MQYKDQQDYNDIVLIYMTLYQYKFIQQWYTIIIIAV